MLPQSSVCNLEATSNYPFGIGDNRPSYYCDSLFYGLLDKDIRQLQWVLNCLARAMSRKHLTTPSIPPFKSLHWLLVNFRSQYKIILLIFNTLTTIGAGVAQWLERRTRNRKEWVRIRLVPITKALYHTCFICGQICKWRNWRSQWFQKLNLSFIFYIYIYEAAYTSTWSVQRVGTKSYS